MLTQGIIFLTVNPWPCILCVAGTAEPTVPQLKNNGEKGSRTFYFEILRAPLEIPANMPGQFSLFGRSLCWL